jgi:hypothetical protein
MIRKLIVSAALLAASTAAIAVPIPINENFDDISTLAASGWSMVNNSSPAGETGWFQGNSGVFEAQSGAADSYIAANFLNAGFGGTIDNWLITPTVQLFGYADLSFSTRSGGAFPDALEVYFNETGSINPADFVLLGSLPLGSYPTDWTTINLQYTGSVDASFAFRYHVENTAENGDYIGIDSVQVKAVPEPEVLSLFALGLLLTPLAMRRRRARA